MSQVIFDPSKASQSASATRVPARVMTDAELQVIFIPNSPSANAKAPAGRAIVKTPACVYEITLFKNGELLGMSASRDYLSASIPQDVQSAILERCEAQMKAPVEVTLTNYVINWFENPRGAQKGFLQLELLDQGKIWSLRFGVSNRTGKAYLMESEIYKKPENADDAIETLEDGKILNGRYRVNATADGFTVTKSDIRTGGVHLSPEVYQAALELVSRAMIDKGYLASTTPMVVSSVAQTETETVMMV